MNEKMRSAEFRKCPLCGGWHVSVITKLRYALFDDSPLSDSYDLVSCHHCGFVYCDTKSTADDFHNHYSQNKHYMSETSGTGGLSDIDIKRYKSAYFLLKRYHRDKTVETVDIGSGKGGFLSFLKKVGYVNLFAVEVLPECVEFIRHSGIDAEVGSADQIPMDDGCANTVILSHVLEHVVDLQKVINEVFRVTADGGLVYAEVPTIEYGCSVQDAPMWDFFYEHINYFSMHHFVSLFERNRFVCLEWMFNEVQNENAFVKCANALFKKDIRSAPKEIAKFNMQGAIANQIEVLNHNELLEIRKLAEKKIPCYIWGISAYMQLLLAMSAIGECNIVSYLDNSKYKQTKTINGMPILSPECLKDAPSESVVIFPCAPYGKTMNQYLDEICFSGKRMAI